MKCCQCVDQLIAEGGSYPETDLPDADTLVPVVQSVMSQGGHIVGLVALPVCFDCRQKMLKNVSKTGLALG